MKKFPGVMERVGQTFVMNDEQKEWFIKWFQVTENKRLSKAMGVCVTKVGQFAREFGLKKSEKGMEAIRKRRKEAARRTNERNGCYDRKRGHAPSAATMEGNKRRWEEERAGLRKNALVTMREERPKAYAAMLEKRSLQRKECIRKEKMRVLYGLERKTNLKAVVLKPYTQSQLHRRHSALLRGYLLDEDCSEGSEGRYIIYYDDETKRSERFERNARADGFTFKRDE